MVLSYIFAGIDQNTTLSLTSLSLFTEFCLRVVEFKYFDLLKDFIEDKLANESLSMQSVCFLVSLIRKVAKCQRTEYGSKFVELIQNILAKIEKQLPYEDSSDKAKVYAEMLSDMDIGL